MPADQCPALRLAGDTATRLHGGITLQPASQPARSYLQSQLPQVSEYLPNTLTGSPFCFHTMLRNLPLSHPITRKDSAPSRKWAWRKNHSYRFPCHTAGDGGIIPGWWPLGSWAGRQWAGAQRWWAPTLQACVALGTSAYPTCLLTLPRVLPAGPQCLSLEAEPSAEACRRQCLWNVFSRHICCCITSQLKGQFRIWPEITGYPPMDR